MTNTPTLAANSPSIETDVVPDSDRRTAPRICCHTLVTAVVPQSVNEGEQLQVMKARSEDVSIGGAKLISKEPLPSKRLFLRFLLPTFGDRYVEAEVVSETRRDHKSMNGQVTTQYVYGVKFTGVMADDDMMDKLMPCPSGTPLQPHAD